MSHITKSITIDLMKNRAILFYCLLIALMGWGLFLMESQPEKSILALLQLTLIVIPLITSVFTTVYYYNSAEFVQLLLIQPVRRGRIFSSLYQGLTFGFVISYMLGVGLPLVIFYPTTSSIFLVIAGVSLSVIFTSLSLFVSVVQTDKARSIGIVLLIWAFFAFIFEGIQLLLMYQYADYPLEIPILCITFLNPISLARILVVMQTEAAALMGLSGAVFKDFFGSLNGAFAVFITLFTWASIPYYLAYRKFIKKDF